MEVVMMALFDVFKLLMILFGICVAIMFIIGIALLIRTMIISEFLEGDE